MTPSPTARPPPIGATWFSRICSTSATSVASSTRSGSPNRCPARATSSQYYEDYRHHPFNLATEAERQPGSSFKPFTLAVGLEHGFGPSSVFTSAPLDIVVPHTGGKEIFHVHNFGNAYSGVITLQGAT